MTDDPIAERLRVAQRLIGRCLYDLRELTSVLGLLAHEAHESGIVGEERFDEIAQALSELDTSLTRALELFPPEGS